MLGRLHAWWDARRGGSTATICWVATRLLILAVFGLLESFVVGDVTYYHSKIRALFSPDVGLADTLTEYPTPVVWILTIPYGLGAGTRLGYIIAFVTLMMALDGLFTWLLWRTGGRRHDGAIDFWLVFVLLIGPLSYLRFDILPAVLAGGALLAARRRPAIVGALTGLGAAVKLWPALLIPAFLAHKEDRKRAGLAFVVVGFGLALVSLLAGGWDRLVSPLKWQSDRGLQVESLWATPLLIVRALHPGTWLVDITDFHAYEIIPRGEGQEAAVATWLTVSSIVTVVGLLTIIGLIVLAFRAADPAPVALGLVVIATVGIMIVTNKTLSPQYVLWFGGPVAALLLLRTSMPIADRRLAGRLAGQVVLLALLTHLVYPSLYGGLLGHRGDTALLVATAVTAVRNVGLLAFTVEVTWLAARHLRRDSSRTVSPARPRRG